MSSPKLRVLFADDHADTVDMICLLLQAEGFEVVGIRNAWEVLKLAEEQEFDAFVFDLWMPEISGVELCERIRKVDSSTPIVIYSGVASESHRQVALAAGAQVYLTKPIETEELVKALLSTINARSI